MAQSFASCVPTRQDSEQWLSPMIQGFVTSGLYGRGWDAHLPAANQVTHYIVHAHWMKEASRKSFFTENEMRKVDEIMWEGRESPECSGIITGKP